MRKTKHGDNRGSGMAAAIKATAIVLAVGMLALVAGRSAYTPDAGSAAMPAHVLAAGPAGVAAPELRIPAPPRSRTRPAADAEPAATF